MDGHHGDARLRVCAVGQKKRLDKQKRLENKPARGEWEDSGVARRWKRGGKKKLAISSLSGVVTVAAPLITSTLGSTGNSQKQDAGEMYQIAV